MEGTIAVLILFGFMAMIAAIVIVPALFPQPGTPEDGRNPARRHREGPAAADRNGRRHVDQRRRSGRLPPSPSRDLRTGIIWLGVAVGFAAMGVALGFEEPEALFPMLACAAFPVFIGLAFIVLWLRQPDQEVGWLGRGNSP